MELFLRNAYGMPLHDVERERDWCAGGSRSIEANMAAAGARGRQARARCDGPRVTWRSVIRRRARAPRNGARGRLFVVGPRRCAGPGVRASCSGARSKRRSASPTRRSAGSASPRWRRISAIPPSRHLRAAVGARGRVAGLRRGADRPLRGQARRGPGQGQGSLRGAPWLYEAKKLEGDAHYAMGSLFRHDAAFDWDKMMALFRRRRRPTGPRRIWRGAIRRSTGRSVSSGRRLVGQEATRDRNVRAGFDTAEAACARAVEASGADVRARVQRALVLSARGRVAS